MPDEIEKRQYILYDGRASFGDTFDASVFVACDSDEEACSYKGDYGQMVCFSYAIKENPGDEPDELVDERFEWNWYP